MIFSSLLFQFVSLCLLSLAAGAPSKLGHHDHHHEHRQARQGGQGGYIAPAPEPQAAATVVEARVAAPVVGIRSQSFDAPNPEFRYSFETENDIKQEAEGTLRNVGGTDVVVMRGSYSYVGVDGNTWTVDWYADETGYHPSAPFLPQPVAPNHPEVAAAVEAQLRFAAEQEAAEVAEAAASSRSESYAAPAPLAAYGY